MISRRSEGIALVTAPGRIGGLESAVAELAAGLAVRQSKVSVIQLLTSRGAEAEAFASLGAQGVELVTIRSAARDYLGEARRLARMLDERGVAVVHAHGERADLASRLARRSGMSLVSTVHGFVIGSLKTRLVKTLHVAVLSGFDGVIAVSNPLAVELRRRISPSRIHAIPNALGHREKVPREAARHRLGLSDSSAPVIGWVGRFSPEKAPDRFLRVFALLAAATDAVAVMIGDGPQWATCRALAEQLGIAERCVFPGMIPDAGVLFSAFDVFVLSSQTEGTPITVLESMRAEVPVVATAVGGVPDLLGEDAGWLVADSSASAFAGTIREVLGNADDRHRRVQAAARRIREDFDVDRWVDRHLDLYATLRASSSS